MRVDDDRSHNTSLVNARLVAARVRIVQRGIAVAVNRLDVGDMVPAEDGNHARCRASAREAIPVSRKIQLRNDFAEYLEADAAATKSVRASCRSAANYATAVGIPTRGAVVSRCGERYTATVVITFSSRMNRQAVNNLMMCMVPVVMMLCSLGGRVCYSEQSSGCQCRQEGYYLHGVCLSVVDVQGRCVRPP